MRYTIDVGYEGICYQPHAKRETKAPLNCIDSMLHHPMFRTHLVHLMTSYLVADFDMTAQSIIAKCDTEYPMHFCNPCSQKAALIRVLQQHCSRRVGRVYNGSQLSKTSASDRALHLPLRWWSHPHAYCSAGTHLRRCLICCK
jgi:hypothetical protein